MTTHRHWIPPLPLAAAMGFQCLAWLLVWAHAVTPSFGLELAWIHAVALGWLTLVALAVLLHVVPAFTDLEWKEEHAARAVVMAVALAALGLVVSFGAGFTLGVVIAAFVLSLALVVYTALAIRTLSHPAADKTSAVVARGLMVTQVALGLTALLGGLLGAGYARGAPAFLLSLAPSHAVLGIVGWLTLLVSGVSVRTFRPLLGAESRWGRAHIAADLGLFAGAVVAAVAAPWSVAVFQIGVLIGAAGAALYVVDAVDILRRATSPNPAARAFVAASIVWLAVATVLVVAMSWGVSVAGAAVVIALAGWLGQMVNAHIHHLGVRVVSTFILGDDDETRPWTLLTPALTWSAFVTGQLAVVGTALRALGAPATIAWFAGAAGLLSVGCIVANAAVVIRRASALRDLVLD